MKLANRQHFWQIWTPANLACEHLHSTTGNLAPTQLQNCSIPSRRCAKRHAGQRVLHTPIFKGWKKLYYGISEKPLLPDTTKLPEEIVSVDIWHWRDNDLQPEQLRNLNRERERYYLGVMHLEEKRAVQLATKDMANVILSEEGNADWALGLSDNKYEYLKAWEGAPVRNDIYAVNLKDGSRKLIRENERAFGIYLSPSANMCSGILHCKAHG
jgi:hypothetical protein